MAFEYWDSLSYAEKLKIVRQAEKEQDATRRRTCFWCRASLDDRYDYTSNVKDPREICKGVCKALRFFDNPDEIGMDMYPFGKEEAILCKKHQE